MGLIPWGWVLESSEPGSLRSVWRTVRAGPRSEDTPAVSRVSQAIVTRLEVVSPRLPCPSKASVQALLCGGWAPRGTHDADTDLPHLYAGNGP